MRYDYWVIRYVPDPIRGERVNVGVIAGSGDDWALRRVGNLQRASRLGGSATVTADFLTRIEAAIESQLDQIQSVLEPATHERLSKGLIEDLRARMNNVVQISPPKAVLAEDADEAADLAFELMVVDAGHEVNHRSRTLVVRRLQAAFELQPSVLQHVTRSQRATVGAESTTIDIAVSRQVVRQLSQAWAFDVKDLQRVQTQIHAWNYMMSRLRSEGGVLSARRTAKSSAGLAIPRNVDINVVFRRPGTDAGRRQFDMALDGWSRLRIDAVDVEDAASLVDEARQLIDG